MKKYKISEIFYKLHENLEVTYQTIKNMYLHSTKILITDMHLQEQLNIIHIQCLHFGTNDMKNKIININRPQYVLCSFNACKSDIMLHELGVVQGSKCGSLFFEIYSNEFSILCNNDKHILYADNTCLIYILISNH